MLLLSQWQAVMSQCWRRRLKLIGRQSCYEMLIGRRSCYEWSATLWQRPMPALSQSWLLSCHHRAFLPANAASHFRHTSHSINQWMKQHLYHKPRNVFSGVMYLMKHLICTICSSHRNDHRTSSIDCDLHNLMNTILWELRNVKDVLTPSPLIIIHNILSGVLSTTAFYLTFYVASLLHRIVLYSAYMYRIVAIQPLAATLQQSSMSSTS